jgi:hypothetical protein
MNDIGLNESIEHPLVFYPESRVRRSLLGGTSAPFYRKTA